MALLPASTTVTVEIRMKLPLIKQYSVSVITEKIDLPLIKQYSVSVITEKNDFQVKIG